MLFDDPESYLRPICFICGLDSIVIEIFPPSPALFCAFVENLWAPC